MYVAVTAVLLFPWSHLCLGKQLNAEKKNIFIYIVKGIGARSWQPYSTIPQSSTHLCPRHVPNAIQWYGTDTHTHTLDIHIKTQMIH